MRTSDKDRISMKVCALIGLSFLWTGCGYLSWMYHLTDYFTGCTVDMLTEVAGYLFQAAGMGVIIIFGKRLHYTYTIANRYLFALLSSIGMLLTCLAVMSPTSEIALIFGYGMNFIYGMIAAYYLTVLAVCADPDRFGLLFGAGYGIGSICSYLLSLPGHDNFLADDRILIIYIVIAALAVVIDSQIKSSDKAQAENAGKDIGMHHSEHKKTASVLWLAAATVFTLSCVKASGFYYPSAIVSSYDNSLEFSRAFYAAGLIAAGIINDRKRPLGAVLCIAALIMPFFSMIAVSHEDLNYILWITGYAFFGFFAVYRIILFIDLSGSMGIPYLAPAGLLFGRTGDAAGDAIRIMLQDHPVALVSASASLFVICVLLFFMLYQMIYIISGDGPRDSVMEFASQYDLSQRETDILRMVLSGSTNKEIAGKLYISENTVKFHVRNILRKTKCSKRKELLSLYSSSSDISMHQSIS